MGKEKEKGEGDSCQRLWRRIWKTTVGEEEKGGEGGEEGAKGKRKRRSGWYLEWKIIDK